MVKFNSMSRGLKNEKKFDQPLNLKSAFTKTLLKQQHLKMQSLGKGHSSMLFRKSSRVPQIEVSPNYFDIQTNPQGIYQNNSERKVQSYYSQPPSSLDQSTMALIS